MALPLAARARERGRCPFPVPAPELRAPADAAHRSSRLPPEGAPDAYRQASAPRGHPGRRRARGPELPTGRRAAVPGLLSRARRQVAAAPLAAAVDLDVRLGREASAAAALRAERGVGAGPPSAEHVP